VVKVAATVAASAHHLHAGTEGRNGQHTGEILEADRPQTI
jgi:hypothetical protein